MSRPTREATPGARGSAPAASPPHPRSDVERFLAAHEEVLRPLSIESRRAFWQASITGDAAAAQRAARLSADVRKLYADAAAHRQVRAWLERGAAEGLARRQLVLLDHAYTANQLAPEVIEDLEERAQEIEHTFTTFRASVGGDSLTDNEIRDVLQNEGDTPRRREAWEASKEIGARISPRLRELARRRNSAARTVGFPDYYTMELRLQEIEPARLDEIASSVAQQTAGLFDAHKREIDAALSARLGTPADALRPWHYADPFFQDPPPAGDVDLDAFVTGHDVVEVSRTYYARIGLPVDDVLARSDLYERAGKDQHAFCLDVDRAGDVRVLCNVKHDSRWMSTMLHELGHAVYDLYIPSDLPYLLKVPAHTLTTEAVAMFFGALIRNPAWLRSDLDARVDADAAARLRSSRARDLLVFSRWALVMIEFERAFYADPERADLNEVWWSLVARLQRLAPPEAIDSRHDWATKIHLAVAPVYYHNYLLGQLYAAQIERHLAQRGVAADEIGRYFRDAVFAAGATQHWDDLVRASTGARLGADAFAELLQEPGR